MRQIQLFILVSMTLMQSLKSQEKVMQGDTTYWHLWSKNHVEKLKLKNLLTTQNDFSFRYWNRGQVIEIIKINDSITGELTNYIYKFKALTRNRKDILSNKKIIDTDKVNTTYNIIQNSEILNLQSDKMIENWSQWADAITYIIEYSDKKTYWVKKYCAPYSQDSIPESIIVMDFVKKISDALNLTENYKTFEENLPRNGCYNSGGMFTKCYAGNSFGLGYCGSSKLPIGYYVKLNLTYIGKTRTSFGISIRHQFDNNNYDFGLTFGKSKLFLNKKKKYDFLVYNYRERRIDFIEPDIIFENNQFFYGLSLKNNFDIAVGTDYLIDNIKNIGGILYASKWIKKPQIDISAKTSIFKNQIDYKFSISRSFYFNNRFPINSISTGLYYENFKDYTDLNISLVFWL